MLKNLPKLGLPDLLRRRKMTLKQFMSEFGITTYEGLVARCTRMGVWAPSLNDFKKEALPDYVNNPQEGVVVVDAPKESVFNQPIVVPSQPSQKKLRRKRDSSPFNQDVDLREPPVTSSEDPEQN
jgi:hypothetical protein